MIDTKTANILARKPVTTPGAAMTGILTRGLLGGLVLMGFLSSANCVHATSVANITVGGTPTMTPIGGGMTSYTYSVTVPEFDSVSEIIIPELHSGDFSLTGTTLPSNWTATEQTTGLNANAIFYSGATPGAEIILAGTADLNNFSFTLDSSFSTTLTSKWVVNPGEGQVLIDPPVPNSNVPEPASIALLTMGVLGALGASRRRRVRADASPSA